MRRNIFGLIGCSCGVSTFFFLLAPLFKYGSEKTYFSDVFVTGLANSIIIVIAMALAFLGLYFAIMAIVEKRDCNRVLFPLSISGLVAFISLLIIVDKLMDGSATSFNNYDVKAGVGFVLALISLMAYYVLCLIGLIESIVRKDYFDKLENGEIITKRKEKSLSVPDQIARYKKLLDDNIITEEEFSECKRRIIEK